MAKSICKGGCRLCGGSFSKGVIARHLKTCLSQQAQVRASKSGQQRFLHLRIEDSYKPGYWLHVIASPRATLGHLDKFLRDIWLECCGHMSSFMIQGMEYECSGEGAIFGEAQDVGMNALVAEVLEPGMQFSYAYDFGSTTHLLGRAIDESSAGVFKKPVTTLARNDPPEIPCDVCGKPATHICGECSFSGKGWLCRRCAKNHGCGEEMLSPTVNSPRVGVCAYCGPSVEV
jgi:hypothetical protein